MATGRIPTTANSPLTVKGDLFGYSTTQARVPVGNDGETLVADSSTTTGLSYQANWAAGKNKIINGDFTINQRAFTSVTASAYTFDRWRAGIAGDGTATFTPQTFTPGAAPIAGYESTNFLQIATTGQTLTSTQTNISQRIESVRILAGQTATVSFWSKATSGTPKIAVELAQIFGNGGSPSATVNTYLGQATLSTSWTRYSFSISVPSMSGKTIGTDVNTSYLSLNLFTSAGSDLNSRTGSLGIQTTTIQVWGIQIEAGSTATAFQTATGTIQGELAACQRYYYRQGGELYNRFGLGAYASSTISYSLISFPVTMRIAPTAVDFSTLGVFDYSGTIAATSCAIDQSGRNGTTVDVRVASGGTTFRPIALVANASTSGYIGFSAEL
jgi:hypothetical protein